MPQLDLASFFFQVFGSFFAFILFFNFSSYFFLPNLLLILNLRLETIKDLVNEFYNFLTQIFVILQLKRIFFFLFFPIYLFIVIYFLGNLCFFFLFFFYQYIVVFFDF